MTEPQRSLAGYKSKIHEGTDFENPNEGKPILTEFDEYVFKLMSFPNVRPFPKIKEKKNKDGTVSRETIYVDKAICEFEEESTKNIVMGFWRVDSLNFSEDDFESAILKFFRKIGTPVVPSDDIKWEDYFLVGMRFRGRAVIGKDKEKKPTGKYFIDVPTCRPILASDKFQSNTPTNPSQLDSVPKPDASLAMALFIAKGAKNNAEAAFKLAEAKQPLEVTNAFAVADRNGKITYPI